MKTFSKLAISALALTTVLATTSANAITADATALVFVPASIAPAVDGNSLSFGIFTPDVIDAGTITVNAATGVTTSDITMLLDGTAADFTATGNGNDSIIVTIDPSVTLNSGSDSMTATLSLNTPPALTAGVADVKVGGTLSVAAAQAGGSYVGTYNISVAY